MFQHTSVIVSIRKVPYKTFNIYQKIFVRKFYYNVITVYSYKKEIKQ